MGYRVTEIMVLPKMHKVLRDITEVAGLCERRRIQGRTPVPVGGMNNGYQKPGSPLLQIQKTPENSTRGLT